MAYQFKSAPQGTLRDQHVEYNPVTSTLEPATLLEPSIRNLVQNDEPVAAGLQLLFATLTANATTGPDGVTNIAKLAETATTVYHITQYPYSVTTANVVASALIYARQAERTWMHVRGLQSDSAFVGTSWVNLATGAIGTVGTGARLRVFPAGDGGFWIEYSVTPASGTSVAKFQWGPTTGNGVTDYAGTAGNGIYLGHVNVYTPGIGYVCSPLPVTGNGTGDTTVPGHPSGAGRGADAPLSVPISTTIATLGGLVEFIELGSSAIAGARVMHIGKDDDTGARLYIVQTSGGYSLVHHNGTSSVASTLATLPTIGQLVRLHWTFNATTGVVQLAQGLNGGTEVAATASAGLTPAGAWGAGICWINGVGSSNIGRIALRKVVALPGSPTIADLVAY